MSFQELQPKSEVLFSEITSLIKESRKAVAVTMNAALTMLYWKVGKLINDEILKNQRADYGEQIVSNLAKQLTLQYGKGWSEQHLRHCLRSAETIPNEQIVYALSRQFTSIELPPKILLEKKLRNAIEMAKSQIENRSSNE